MNNRFDNIILLLEFEDKMLEFEDKNSLILRLLRSKLHYVRIEKRPL